MSLTRKFIPIGICAGLALLSCSPNQAIPGKPLENTPLTTVAVSWAANREQAVNRTGGGYRVYYGTIPGFSLSGASSVDVPYVSGSSAPTSATLSNLAPGTYYIKVVAYSALQPVGSTSGSTSLPSAETHITVP